MKGSKLIARLRHEGVIIENGTNVFIDENCTIEAGVIIEDNVHILGGSMVQEGARIGSGSYINSAHIGKGVNVANSRIEYAYIGDMTTVGPYAHIHKDSHIGRRVRIGNFVEVKNSNIGDDSKAAHLAYIGDADIGKLCNIGCGAIFVNYDGITKRRSVVGDSVFIGSNCNIIAPVRLEKGAYVAAGSTLTIDLAQDDLCIARCREEVKPGRSKYRKYDK